MAHTMFVKGVLVYYPHAQLWYPLNAEGVTVSFSAKL
jgi:hypothetical protein